MTEDLPKDEDHGLAEFNLFESRIKSLNMEVRDLKRRVQASEARASTLSNELQIAVAEVTMYRNRSILDIEERDFYARYSTALLSKLAALGEAASATAKRTLVDANDLTSSITELMKAAKAEARIGSITSGASPSPTQTDGANPASPQPPAIPFGAKSTPISSAAEARKGGNGNKS